jgi:predicted phosphodiesterase
MQNGLVIATPDKHVPYHHKRALPLMYEIIDYTKPDMVIDLGDFGDNKAFSRHRRKYGERFDPEADMETVIEHAKLQDKAARKKLKMLLGNHDLWFPNYIAENAPAAEKYMKTVGQVYELREEPEPYQETYKIGKVGYVHDLGKFGVNAIRETLMTAGHNIVFGHSHRGGIAYTGNDVGERHFGLNCGWLGDRNEIRYMNRSATKDWQLGFGAIRYVDGLAFASFVPILEDARTKKVTCYFGGKKFVG